MHNVHVMCYPGFNHMLFICVFDVSTLDSLFHFRTEEHVISVWDFHL